MIDPTTLPVLLKAIDFLFDEGKKIMDERRERRKNAEAPKEIATPTTTMPPATPEAEKSIISSKDEALKNLVDESLWIEQETQIKHLLNLLEIHMKNYQLAQKQYSMWGEALVPQIIMNNLENEEKKMMATARELQGLLTKLYGKRFEIISD